MSDKKRKGRVTGVILIALILAVGGVIAYTVLGTGNTGFSGEAAMESDDNQVYTIRTVTVEPSTLEDYLKFNGDVVAENSVDIYPDVSGKLINLNVSLGSYVQKGQTIAHIDPSQPGQVFVASPVKSTISGTVTELPFKIGATISSTTMPVATVGNLKDLQITSYIPEKHMASVELGQLAEVTFEPYKNRIFTGILTEISPVLDKNSRTLEITISLNNEGELIKSGMFGSVRLITDTKEEAFVLPSECIMNTDKGTFVYVVSPSNTVSQQSVTTGLAIDGMVEITSGLESGSLVVIQGMSMLRDGSTVKVSG